MTWRGSNPRCGLARLGISLLTQLQLTGCLPVHDHSPLLHSAGQSNWWGHGRLHYRQLHRQTDRQTYRQTNGQTVDYSVKPGELIILYHRLITRQSLRQTFRAIITSRRNRGWHTRLITRYAEAPINLSRASKEPLRTAQH